jgi:hypothetical protein
MSESNEKFTARFDEKLVEQPNEKYVKPVIIEKVIVIEKVVQSQNPITVTVEVPKKKKKGCSIQ